MSYTDPFEEWVECGSKKPFVKFHSGLSSLCKAFDVCRCAVCGYITVKLRLFGG